VLIFERHLERRVEQELQVRLAELEAAVAMTEGGRPDVMRNLSDPRYDHPYSGSYWQVAQVSGPVSRSRSLWEEQLPFGAAETAGPDSRAFEESGPGKSTLYILQRDVAFESGGRTQRYRLSVALDHAEIEGLGASFRTDVTVALGSIAAVLLLGAWVQLRFGLRPLRRLRRELAAIRAGGAKRLYGAFPDEVKPLIDDLNLLLDKQEEMIGKARKRAGDLAHGLKTPLTILNGEARRLSDTGLPESANTIREQIGLMRVHVERELARARTHGVTVGGGTLTDVALTVQRLVGLMKRMPRGEGLTWIIQVDPTVRLLMDPADFGEVVGNILDNARKWAHSTVTISTDLMADSARLVVIDDGPGISCEDKARILEWGEQGGYDSQGSGLGMAIVNDVLEAYGTRLVVGESAPTGCAISFEMRATTVGRADGAGHEIIRVSSDLKAVANGEKAA
jgi:signal transduction histidine kinase